MELFHRRYFAFFAFLFLLASFTAIFMSGIVKLVFTVILAILTLSAFLLVVINKRFRFAFTVVFVSFVFVTVSFLNSYLFVTLPQENAERYVETTQVAELEILSCDGFSDVGGQYTVRALRIGDSGRVNIKSNFYCSFPERFSFGDKIIALVDIKENHITTGTERDILLSFNADDEMPILLNSADLGNGKYFSFDGISLICKNIRNAFGEYVDKLFGKENGALVKAFLVNDTSDISLSVHADFRRSGTLHLLAVSGLHIALLMGSLEILLRKLFVPKRIRCLLVAIVAIFFLVLTNFAASAVRSVLMLFAIYLNYLFSEDNDTVTALFVSVFLIVLFSPMSVYDLGMWMSFFATLGLVTVYPLLERSIPNVIKTDKSFFKILFKCLISIVKAVILTLTANFFLLPIMWYFFGSISLSAIPANLILSPLSSVYLPLCAIAVVFGWIPYLNHIITWLVGILGKFILYFAKLFANMRGGELSLRYSFVPILIITFTIAFSVLLVVRLKHKLWICAPATVFVISFAVCLTVFTVSAEPKVKYIGAKYDEALIFYDGCSTSVCDIGSGSVASLYNVISELPVYSTEIENYILTHVHKGHISYIERLFTNIPVRTLYLPCSQDRQELEFIASIYMLANEYDTDVIFYESGMEIQVFKDIMIHSCFEWSDISSHPSIFIYAGGEEPIFTYTDISECRSAIERGVESRYFLFGNHGEFSHIKKDAVPKLSERTELIFVTEEEYLRSSFNGETGKLAPTKDNKIKFILPLE